MDQELTDRLERLESRVAMLETHCGLAALPPAAAAIELPAPDAVPAPLPPPPAATALPELPELPALPALPDTPAAELPTALPAAAPPRRPFDLERFFGLAVMGRIGIAAVVLAAAYFAQLGWGHLTPAARVLGIYAAAGAMLGVGAWLRPRVAPKYTALLWGGGVAIAYLAGVAAKLHYDLIGGGPALLLLLASAATGQLLGRLLRLETMALVALAGAYAAPLLVGDRSVTPTGFFVYLAALHAWSAWAAAAWSWRATRRSAVVASAALSVLWLATHAWPAPTSLWLHLEGMWLALAAPELIRLARRRAPGAGSWAVVIAGGIAVQVVLFAVSAMEYAARAGGLVAGGSLLALTAALLRRAPAQRQPIALLADLGAATMAIGVLLRADTDGQTVAGVVAVGLTVLATRRWTAARDVAPLLAGVFAAAWALGAAPSAAAYARAAMVLVLPIALVRAASAGAGRVAALLLGAVAVFASLRLGDSLHGPLLLWAPIAWVPVAAWLGWGAVVGARHPTSANGEPSGAALGSVAMTLLHGSRPALVATVLWGVTVLLGGELPRYGLVAQGLAGSAALFGGWLVSSRRPAGAWAAHGRDLVDLGGALLVLAGYCAWPGALEPNWLRLGTVVGIGAVLLLARARLVGGEWAVSFAAAFAIAAVARVTPSLEARLQMAMVALLPALLVWRGSAVRGAVHGTVLGAVAVGLGVRLGDSLQAPRSWWLPAAGALAVAWATAAAVVRPEARVVRAVAIVRAAAPGLLVVLGLWLVRMFASDMAELHAASGAALAIGAAGLAAEAWRCRRRAGAASDARAARAPIGAGDPAATLCVLGAFVLPNALGVGALGPVGIDHAWARLGGLVLAGALVLAVRRRTAVGDLAPSVAAALAAVVVLGVAPCAASRAHAAPALVAAALLVVAARRGGVRAAALVLATGTGCFAATRQFAFSGEHALWTSIGLGAAGGLAAGGALLGGWRRDRVLLTTAAILLAALGVGWCVIAWQPELPGDATGMTPFLNLRCLCALVLVTLLELARRRLPMDVPALERGTFAAIAIAFAYLAGLVETLALVRGWPEGWSDVTISVYSTVFAAGLLLVGFRRRRPALRYAGLGGFAFAIGKVSVWDLAQVATPLRVLVTGVLGIVLLAGAWAYARNRGVGGTNGLP